MIILQTLFLHLINVRKITVFLQFLILLDCIRAYLTTFNLVVSNFIVFYSWLIIKISFKVEFMIVVNLKLDARWIIKNICNTNLEINWNHIRLKIKFILFYFNVKINLVHNKPIKFQSLWDFFRHKNNINDNKSKK